MSTRIPYEDLAKAAKRDRIVSVEYPDGEMTTLDFLRSSL